jgi:hypothetical protein
MILTDVGGCCVTYKTGLGLDLLTPYTHNSGLQAIESYRYSTHFVRVVPRCTRTSVFSLY